MSALFRYATTQLLRRLPRRAMTRAAGRLADHLWKPALGKAVTRVYCRAYKVELDECTEQGGWTSFDAFFTRTLRNHTRPVNQEPRVVVSPADGRIESMGRVGAGSTTFVVKGTTYRVEDLIGDHDEVHRYQGGAGCVIYLSPRDYHRVHSPVTGTLTSVRSIEGDYFPVNSVGVRSIERLFAMNRRVVMAIDTPESVGLGRVTVVMVAAMIVGRITVKGIDARDVPYGKHQLTPSVPVERGEEIGQFHLGSTVVMFLERRACETWLAGEGPIRFGVGLSRGRGE